MDKIVPLVVGSRTNRTFRWHRSAGVLTENIFGGIYFLDLQQTKRREHANLERYVHLDRRRRGVSHLHYLRSNKGCQSHVQDGDGRRQKKCLQSLR